MKTTRLSDDSRLVIPQEILDRHGWAPGAELEIEDHGDHVVLRRVEDFPEVTLAELMGCADYHGPARSLDEIDSAIGDERRSR